MLTTVDNPYNPFDDFDAWYSWDIAAGYQTISFLGRVASTSDDLSDYDEQLAIDDAIDVIVSENVQGNYRKITRDFPDTKSDTEMIRST